MVLFRFSVFLALPSGQSFRLLLLLSSDRFRVGLIVFAADSLSLIVFFVSFFVRGFRPAFRVLVLCCGSLRSCVIVLI